MPKKKKAEEGAEKEDKGRKKPSKAAAKKEVPDLIQPEINIGLCGHVDHGKTTLLERLSGKWTDTHSEEIKKGITIRLGYADTDFYEEGGIFTSKPKDKAKAKFLRRVSFVDAPGHESLMATMLSGATIMDGALLLVAANEQCPQPQTREHLMALEIIGVKHIVIVQNKVDMVSEEQAVKNYEQIREFIKGTPYQGAPIIPISAQHTLGISMLIQAIQEHIPTPQRDSDKDPMMFVARSFDVNRPGAVLEELQGGVLGGSLKQGILHTGDEIEIRPGRETIEKNQKVYKPLIAKITGLKSGGQMMEQVGPGGSIGVLTSLDHAIVKADSLTGSVVGLKGKIPKVWYEFELDTNLLQRVVGAREDVEVEPIKLGEPLMLNVNSAATVGVVARLGKNSCFCRLKIPVCAEEGSRVTISRKIGNRFRLIGFGVIKS
ncbi:translation initiation factor IF-2 subunit gamma [Candidatus Woesearchaeota archaeon]|nr:translation initiation factor IF-2 subunit gamma [Candidatus Woesearchaeota archaeon]